MTVRRPVEASEASSEVSDVIRFESGPSPQETQSSKPKKAVSPPAAVSNPISAEKPSVRPSATGKSTTPSGKALERAERPIPLCNTCGEPLRKGQCPVCSLKAAAKKGAVKPPQKKPKSKSGEDEFWEIVDE